MNLMRLVFLELDGLNEWIDVVGITWLAFILLMLMYLLCMTGTSPSELCTF